MFCIYCGKALEPESGFCDSCGIPVAEPVASGRAKGVKKGVMAVFGVIFVVAVIIFVNSHFYEVMDEVTENYHTNPYLEEIPTPPSNTAAPVPTPTPIPRITRVEGSFNFPSYRADGSGREFSAPFVWEEGYFAKPAQNYNPSLATISMALSMAAFASAGEAQGQARNAAAMLSQIGFRDIETNYYFTTVPHEDSMGVVVASKEIAADGRFYTLVAISTRGSGYGMEWAGNFTLGTLGYHEGFRLAAEETYRFIADYITRNSHSFHEDIKLWVTGYSRGAAVANLFAAWVTQAQEIAGVPVARENIYAYTFGTPRAVPVSLIQHNEVFTNIHNILNPADIVTWVAPHRWGFGRYGADRFMPERGQIGDPAAFYEMVGFLYVIGTDRALDSIFYINTQPPNGIITSKRLYHATEFFEDVRFDRVTIRPPGIVLAHSSNLMTPFLLEITNGIAAGAGDQESYAIMLEGLLRALIAGAIGEERFVGDRVDLALEIFRSKFGLHNAVEIGLAFAVDGIRGVAVLAAWYMYESMIEAGIDVDGGFTIAGVLLNSFNYIGLNGVLTLINNLDTLAAAHYPEFMLAWMKSQDVNFGGVFREFIPAFRSIGISGPVTICVYDAQGQLITRFLDGVQEMDSHLTALRGHDGITLYLPADAGYILKLTAINQGSLDFSINEFSLIASGYVRTDSWLDVPVYIGNSIAVTIPGFCGDDYNALVSGSSLTYVFESVGDAHE